MNSGKEKKSEFYLKTEVRNGRTVMADSFFTAPCKMMKPFYDDGLNIAKVCLMSTSPGILAGDDYRMEIEIGENSRLHLYSQSAQKLFGMNGAGAAQAIRFILGRGSLLEYCPMPIIPYSDSLFESSCDISMEDGSSLILREMLAAGRCARGEIFKYTEFRSRTNVYYDSSLILADNTVMIPGGRNLAGMGFYEGYTHSATVFFVGNGVCGEARRAAADILRSCDGIRFGVSLGNPLVLSVKMLGRSSESLLEASDNLRRRFEAFLI